jgi:N-acetylmuramoyl-L-alanine amidase
MPHQETSGTAVGTGFQLIKRGDTSESVADVQARLRSLGFEVTDESGTFEESTRRSVAAFQQRRDIIVDGIVGPYTWEELVEASWRLGDRHLYVRRPYLRGDDVKYLQARLHALGFDSGREDGIFGPDTDAAVRTFQREYAIAEDGIFGPRTNAALTGLRVDRPGTSARLREDLQREHRSLQAAVVVIDPGHGGEDRGRVGERGLCEADICWDLAQRLADQTVAAGARVRFTRTESEAPDVSERAQRANEFAADVLLSIHLNWHDDATAEGASTYHFSTSRNGEHLAHLVQGQLVGLGVRDCRYHPVNYPLLRETRMPAVLVEPAFITSPFDTKRLDDPEFRESVAKAIASGLRLYYER